MFIGIGGKGKINTVANLEAQARISGIDFSRRTEERYGHVCIFCEKQFTPRAETATRLRRE